MNIPNLPEPVITENGKVLISHFVMCTACNFIGIAYLNMSHVDLQDKVHNFKCCICNRESVEIVTYKLLDELIKNNFEELGDEGI